MDSHSTARRPRLRSSSSSPQTKQEKASLHLENIAPIEFGNNSDSSKTIPDGTQNNSSLSCSSSSSFSSLPSNARKWSPPLPPSETPHSEKLDALMFEAMDSNIHSKKNTNNINNGRKVSRIRQVKSGRRSWSRSSAKEELRRGDYSFQWRSANVDQFFSDSPKSFKDSSKKENDDVSDRILKWEPFRIKVVGNGDNRKSVDSDIVYSFGSKENFDDEFGGSDNCNGRDKIDNEKLDADIKDVNTWGFKNRAFVFGPSQPKSNVIEEIHKFQTDSVYGEFQGLAQDVDYASTADASASRSQRSLLMNNISISNNQVAPGRLQTRRDPSVMSSSLGSTRIDDSSSQGDESLTNVDSSSSNLDIPFQFGAKREVTKVQHGGRKTETKNVSIFNSDRGGYQSHGFEGNSKEFSETPSNNIPFNKCEGGTGSTQKRHISKPSSAQGFLASGFAGEGHRLVVEERMKSRSSIDKFESSPFSLQPVIFQTDAAQGYASSVKGDLFDSNQIAGKENNTVKFPGGDATSVPDSISTLYNQTSKSDLAGITMAVNNAASEKACESWRYRGNQAYAEGEFSKAEEYYTRAISCVSPSETSENCVRALVLCYSNRAITRVAVSRYREALSDCMQALNLDPNFMKARVRAASCHLALGEYELALAFFKDCLRSQNESEIVDSKLASEALEGIRKTQQVEEKTDHAVRLLSMKESEHISNSLCLVNEALSTSPHSEKLLELKAQALLALRKYEEVIQTCEEGLASVNQNHYCGKSASENQNGNTDTYGAQCKCPIKLLFWQMTGKAQFYLGRLEEALASLLKFEEANTAAIKSSGQKMETLAPFVATIRDLLHHKAAGNESFQAGNYVEAEKHYTAALSCNTESRPFTAVCFGNRAAASHAQGHIADAIADCSRAMALDTKYLKAVSRRSILHEMIRNHGQVVSDLQRLLTVQDSEQQYVKGGSLTRTGSSCNSALDLKGARDRLAKAQEDTKKGIPLDHYLILGVEPSCTAAEIKKAYRKAALKHHPDKAAQFLVGSDGGDDELLKECVEEVRRDAEKLFQLIAEAYAILSDPAKRLQYDSEEELQKLRPTRGTSTAEPGLQSKSSLFEKSSRQHRQGWNAWKDYENQYNHWNAWKDYENQYNWRTHPEASQSDNRTGRGPVNTSEGVGWSDYYYDCI